MILPAGGLPSGTPRTIAWKGAPEGAGPQATPHGFIARANESSIALWLPGGKGPFIPLPEGRGMNGPRMVVGADERRTLGWRSSWRSRHKIATSEHEQGARQTIKPT
jgi:hypothetical protein